jgi:predicted RNA-binding protein associated with RNAse of E/G family
VSDHAVRTTRIYYRKEKLRGACWEYQIDGGWLAVPTDCGERLVLHHRFSFYRPREIEVRTCNGVELLARTGAEQWFFPDRWFSLLRFTTEDDRTVGYYVNFSQPLAELRQNYYRDLDLELDLWLDPDGTATELDRDEFDAEIAQDRMEPGWVREVDLALERVSIAVARAVAEFGPNLDERREQSAGLPQFILRA